MSITYYHLLYLFLVISIRWFFIGAGLLQIYEKIGVEKNWIAMIPFVGFKPLFEYVGVGFWLILLSFIPEIGIYVFSSLICFVLLRFGLKIRMNLFVIFGLTVLAEIFLLFIAYKKDVDYNPVDELEVLRRKCEEAEKLENEQQYELLNKNNE